MSKSVCLDCSQRLESYVHGRYGRCDHCFDRLAALPAALKIPSDVLVRVSYFPGFAADLTCWETYFFNDGSIKQSIRWYERIHGKDREPELHGELDDAKLCELDEALASINFPELHAYRHCFTADDMPIVHIFSPEHNLHVSVSQWSVSDDRLTADARAGRDQFQQAWRVLDSWAPYTTGMHHRKRQ